MIVLVFLFGLLFGSLANVILLRFNTGESLVYGGSRCFCCARHLEWYELIPLFSFLFLRAKCRSCKSKISWQYPLVELGTGVLFLVVYLTLNSFQFLSSGQRLDLKYLILNTEYLILVIVAWYALWLSALYDLRHKILPDFFNYSALVLAVCAFLISEIASFGLSSIIHDSKFIIPALTSAALFSFFFLLWFFSRGRWMGLGDAKFVLTFGFLMAPSQALLAIMLAFWVGAVVGILLVIFSKLSKSDLPAEALAKTGSHRRKLWESDFHIKTEIPFGPFLFLGAILSFVLGDKIINWYIQLF